MSGRPRRIGAALVVWLAATPAAVAAPDHEAYVWQRQWSTALRTALLDSRADYAGLRLLVAQADRSGQWTRAAAVPDAFDGDPRRLTAVIRYDGAGRAPEPAALGDLVDDLSSRWRAAGHAFEGIEIDYDCARARLADYAIRLRAVRARLPAGMRLSITALPAWLGEPALKDVLGIADEAVLQVHSVQDPSRGLFDAPQAEAWIRTFAAVAPKPFRVALPAYGSRVRFGPDGRAVAVQSEMIVDAAQGDDGRELRVDPADVVALLGRLRADPPRNWQGVVWFRLPVAGDRRAWTEGAIRDVMAGQVPAARLSAHVVTRPNGASDVVVANDGAADAMAPVVGVDGDACTMGDATAGWSGTPVASGWRYTPGGTQWVTAGTQRAVGWVRCARIDTVHID